MSERTVVMCDKCEKVKANSKCEICEMDLCEGCDVGMVFDFNGAEFDIPCCQKCHTNLDRWEADKEFLDKIKKEVLEYCKKKNVIESLDKKEDKDDKDNQLNKLIKLNNKISKGRFYGVGSLRRRKLAGLRKR